MVLDELNAADRTEFAVAVGFAFEHSPWVAEAAWERRPFDSAAELLAAMTAAVDAAGRDRQLALIRAHPELATSSALTPASSSEQASAGLDRLDAGLRDRLLEATAAYGRRFGFPFVICVREHDLDGILAAAERRLGNQPAVEVEAALAEIGKIAALRLDAAIEGP